MTETTIDTGPISFSQTWTSENPSDLSKVNATHTAEILHPTHRELMGEVLFLLDRIFDYSNCEEAGRLFHGHVLPSAERLRAMTQTSGAAQ